MELHEYFRKLKKQQKIKFFELINKECRVKDSTIYSWVAKPEANNYREAKPVYKAILSRVTGIAEECLFPVKPENELPKF